MHAGEVTLRARGGAVGDRWCGELLVPTPGGDVVLTACVTDADVRALLAGLRRAHRALHSLDDVERRALIARGTIAHGRALAAGAEVGVWPIVAAIAIPLLTAAAGYGVQATTPGFGGRTASGAAITTYAGSPVDEVPRGAPSVEEVRAEWATRGADRPEVVIAELRSPDGNVIMPAHVEDNPMRRLRDVELQWLGAYHRGYFGTVLETAAQVPAQVRAAWQQARAQGVPLWRTLGLAGPPSSPVPVGQPLAGSSLLAGGYTPTAPWAQGSGTPEAALAMALQAIASGAASAASGQGLSWQQALGRLVPALAGAASQGGSPQASQALAMLAQLAPLLTAAGGAQQPGAAAGGANPLAALQGLLGGAQQPGAAAGGANPLAALQGLLGGAQQPGGANPLAALLGGALGAPGTPPQLATALGQLAGGAPAQPGLAGLLGASGLLGAGSTVAAPGAAPQLAGAQGVLGQLLGGAPTSTAGASSILSQLLGAR